MKNERRLLAGFADMLSALSLRRLDSALLGKIGLDALATLGWAGQCARKVPSRVIVYRLWRQLTQDVFAANANIWGLTERLLRKMPLLHPRGMNLSEIRESRFFFGWGRTSLGRSRYYGFSDE